MSASTLGLAVSLPIATELYATPSDYPLLIDLARMADGAGVRSLIVVDHVVMGEHPEKYEWGTFKFPPETPWLEPITLLAAMASATTDIRMSTGILIAPLRPAALLAKSLATLDVLSRGRVELGVGTGWQEEEFTAQGMDFARRGELLDDTMAACQALWAPGSASFDSPTVSFQDIWCEPKPVQPGGPPILFSGTLTGRNLRRIERLGSGWLPIMNATMADIEAGIATLHTRLRGAGRDPSELRVRGRLAAVRDADGRVDLDATLDGAAAFAAIGVTDVSVRLMDHIADHSEAAGFFERLATLWPTKAG